jgi:hypothetical protein
VIIIPAIDAQKAAPRKSILITRGTLMSVVRAEARAESTSLDSIPNLVRVIPKCPVMDIRIITTTMSGIGPMLARKICMKAAPVVPGSMSG